MQFKSPKNDAKYQWTVHVQDKMRYYGISESLIKRIIRFPERVEEGIAPRTVAAMKPTSNKKNPQEIWVMYRHAKNDRQSTNNEQRITNNISFLLPRVLVISAWRYPGISPKGRKIPIPDDILQELEGVIE